jgi:hypothetical protein
MDKEIDSDRVSGRHVLAGHCYTWTSLNPLLWTYSLTIKLENDFSGLMAKTINAFSLSESARLATLNSAINVG